MIWLLNKVRAPFYDNGRFCLSTTLIFTIINLVVFINALLHNPTIGYDSDGHLNNIAALSKGHLVTREESPEFFSPPLPYLFPAAIVHLTTLSVYQAAKIAQLFNVLLSIGTTFFLLRVCHLISSGTPLLKQITLGFLGILPVYYKTFAFVRGEPFVVFFVVASTYYTLQIFGKLKPTIKNTLFLGIGIGLAGLSRQWGFLFIPAITALATIVVLKHKTQRRPLIISFISSLSLAFLISSWFFLSLLWRYGSLTTFNREPYEQFIFSNQKEDFFSALETKVLLTEPVRDNFSNQFWPIFYSEIWGDYWGYFVIYGKDLRTNNWLNGFSLSTILSQEPQPTWLETNRFTFAPYLGRANGLGLFPTLLGVIALFYGGMVGIWHLWQQAEPNLEATSLTLLFFLVVVSLMGYFVFLIMYPTGYGDTVKATYMLHIFPGVALLVGVFLQRVEQKFPVGVTFCKVVGTLIFLHNLPIIITRFISISTA